jgi:PiT family inorganic phosphate transporter
MSLFLSVIILALVFDFINGFHDAANSIATVVSTKVLSPLTAVIWAAGFNFLAYAIFHLKVADTVSKTVNTEAITLSVIACGLVAAIIWNLFTWWKGIPSSSSHTLIGGFAGAAIAHAGWDVVKMDKVAPVLYFIVLAPVIGMIVSYLISVLMLHLFKKAKPTKVNNLFRGLQLLSSAAFSLGHGGNDAQKVMGIIGAAMIVNGSIGDMNALPHWVEIACYSSIAFGTLFGGWRIVKTMGSKITKLEPFEGFAAETAGAVMLFGTGAMGIPVSTTHTITGAIVGVGVTKRVSAVRWGVTIDLLWAWVLTIPVSALMGMGIYYLVNLFSR